MKKATKLFLSVGFLAMCFSCSTSNSTSQEKESSLSQNTDSNTSSATSSNGSSIDKYQDCTGTLARFPQEELNAFYGYQELIPSYASDSYSYEGLYYAEGGYHVFDISSVVSETASAASYKSICEQAGLTVNDEYFSTYGIYLTQSVNAVYQLQFGEEEGLFFIEVFDNAEDSGSGSDVQVNQVTEFPQAQLDAYMGFVETVPSYESTLYNYVETVDNQGYKVFEIFSDISSTVSASAYKTICEQAGLTVDDSAFATYGVYIVYSANNKYYIEFYDESGVFYLDIFDDTAAPSETIPTGEGQTATFPQEMIDTFFESTEIVPSFEASSYEYFYGPNLDGEALFEVAALISETASINAYKTICATNGLDVYDDYFVSDGVYITYSANGLYQIQFCEDSGYFIVDIYKL